MRYKKKPVVIEAVQFFETAESITEISDLAGKNIIINYNDPKNPYLKIETLEGTMKANVGDYIIKGVRGELYPCKKDIFEETYEKVE